MDFCMLRRTLIQQMSKVKDCLVEVNEKGAFVRSASGYRDYVKVDTDSKFPAEKGRYHLYISYACPWATRCLAFLYMKGLEGVIGVTTVHPVWQYTKKEVDNHAGWVFTAKNAALKTTGGYGSFAYDETEIDPINGCKTVRELYELVGDSIGKYTVPILWDTKTNQIVNNESSEIIEMFNSAFDKFAPNPGLNLFPDAYAEEMKLADAWIYDDINNGVYKNGFAKSQEAYEAANVKLFESLDRLDELLSTRKFICGDIMTASDVRAFMTLIRFDEVYVVYFKCDKKKISEYPNLLRYCRDLWKVEGIRKSINMKHIKQHYFCSHSSLNIYGIVPTGPNFIGKLEMDE